MVEKNICRRVYGRGCIGRTYERCLITGTPIGFDAAETIKDLRLRITVSVTEEQRPTDISTDRVETLRHPPLVIWSGRILLRHENSTSQAILSRPIPGDIECLQAPISDDIVHISRLSVNEGAQ